jgi:ABC-type Fe3+ transport system permease subunit
MFTWALDHVWIAIQLAFAGAWAGLWHKGVLWVVIACSLGLAFGSQLLAIIPGIGAWLVKLFAPLRKDLLWVAFIAGVILASEYVGAHDATLACTARTVVIENVTDTAVSKTKTPAARKQKDPYDNPEN